MINFKRTLILLTVFGLCSCGSSPSLSIDTASDTSSPSSEIPSGSDSESSPSGEDSSSEAKDYGTTYDTFDKSAGEFDALSVIKTDSVDNRTIYGGYYAALSGWDNGTDLKHKLFDIIFDENVYTPLSYDGNWLTNQSADEAEELLDNVNVVYNANDQKKTDTYSSSNTYGWSREHAFCASLLTGSLTSQAVKTLGIATDFHNLFAANSGGNSSRSDKNFGNVSDDEDISSGYASAGRAGYDYQFTTETFEPGDSDKGMLSRAILYMSVMYGKDSWNDNPYKTGDGVYLRENTCSISDTDHCIGHSSTLVDWSNTYLVDRKEYKHNISVYSQQHNRNPFVDFVNLADYVYGNKKDSGGTIDDLISAYSYLGLGEEGTHNLAVSDFAGEYTVGQTFTFDDLNVYKIGNDFSKSEIEDGFYTMKLDDSDISLPYTFEESDIGEKTLTVSALNGTLGLDVNILADGINSCNNVHDFTSYVTSGKSDSTSRDEVKAKSFSVNDYKFNISFTGCSPDESSLIGAITNDGTYGVKVGSTTKYCESMIFESEETIDSINKIYLQGATAASTQETVIFEILDENGNDLAKQSCVISRDNMLCKMNLDSAVSGKIRVTFTNKNHKAIYLTSIAFNAI